MSSTSPVLVSREHTCCQPLLATCRMPVASLLLVERSSVVGPESGGWSGDLSGDPSHSGRAPVLPEAQGRVGSGTPLWPRRRVSLVGAISSHLTVSAAHSVGSLGVPGHPGGIWHWSGSTCHPCFYLPSPRASTAAQVGLQEHP